jgi:serine/threonine protein kinase
VRSHRAHAPPAFHRGQSPEQLRGKLADPNCDIYAFGAVLYEVLSGKPAFAGDHPNDVAVAHKTQAAPKPSTVAPRDDLCSSFLQMAASSRPAKV